MGCCPVDRISIPMTTVNVHGREHMDEVARNVLHFALIRRLEKGTVSEMGRLPTRESINTLLRFKPFSSPRSRLGLAAQLCRPGSACLSDFETVMHTRRLSPFPEHTGKSVCKNRRLSFFTCGCNYCQEPSVIDLCHAACCPCVVTEQVPAEVPLRFH